MTPEQQQKMEAARKQRERERTERRKKAIVDALKKRSDARKQGN